ncbi:hypothetical protein Tco_0639287 [Tanacetum coccineum]
MAKKLILPAVDLSGGRRTTTSMTKEDVVMRRSFRTQTSVRWTRDEEKLLCEVWVGVFENSDIGNDRNEECFWGQIHDDFNKSTNGVFRTKNMITGEWNRMQPDCQKFHAIYKDITLKRFEIDGVVLEVGEGRISACNKGEKKLLTKRVRGLLRPRPPGKTRPAKKTKSETTESSAGSGSGSMKDVLNEELRQKIQAGKSAYEAKKIKEQSATELNELQFLTIDADSLPEPRRQ